MPPSCFMKSPPPQFTDDVARRMVEEFIAGDAIEHPSLDEQLEEIVSQAGAVSSTPPPRHVTCG